MKAKVKRAPARARDSQRQKVYNAENDLPEFRGPRLETVPEMQAWVDSMIATKWWQRHFPHVQRIEVRDGRGRTRACGSPSGRFISMPAWSRSKLIILHEISHVVTYVSVNIPWHGWQFCENYIALVQHFMGADVARRLKLSFKHYRVKYSKPRAKKTYTEEQLAAMRERMEVARAARSGAS